MRGPLSEELAQRIVHAVRELRECVESGEHPLAADKAVRLANGRLNVERCHWGMSDETERRSAILTGALTCCEKASRYYAYDPDLAREQLELALRRLQPLADDVNAMREMELCGV